MTLNYFSFLKGMVEKWLLQVEEMMLSSVRQVLQDGIKGYSQVIIPELWNKFDFINKCT